MQLLRFLVVFKGGPVTKLRLVSMSLTITYLSSQCVWSAPTVFHVVSISTQMLDTRERQVEFLLEASQEVQIRVIQLRSAWNIRRVEVSRSRLFRMKQTAFIILLNILLNLVTG